MSSLCVPSWTILPLSSTTILSAVMMVDRRWAMMIVVRLCMSCLRACWICDSVLESNEDVASSSTSIFLLASNARAMETRCFSPPESLIPRSPTMVFSF